jgi:hypothetical protein
MPPEASNNRDDFTSNTKKIIAQRSGYRCAICGCQTEGPGLDPDKAISIGDAGHITAASSHGPRYNVDLTKEQRTDAGGGPKMGSGRYLLILAVVRAVAEYPRLMRYATGAHR